MRYPRFRFEPPPVYFMHIPKTAGSSLRQLLFSAYAPKQARGVDALAMQQIESTAIGGFRCIASHLGPGLLPFLHHEDLACITMLREPVEQHISNLYYRQTRINQHPETFQPAFLEQIYARQQADLPVDIDQLQLGIRDNTQTRFLGNALNLRAYFKDGEIGRLGQPLLYPLNLPSLTANQDIKQIAERAHQQLAQMAVVGITEYFAESLALICDLLGIPLPRHLPALNIGSQKHSVAPQFYRTTASSALVARIEAATRYDQELYAHARERFFTQFAHHQARPRRTISVAARLRAPIQQAKNVARKGKCRLLAVLPPVTVRQVP